MENQMSNIAFKMMVTFGMPIRNLFIPPKKILAEVEIKTGYHILDFGCGPATFTKTIAEKIGKSGKFYALDIHPVAVKSVEKIAQKKNFSNIETILSNCYTSLPPDSLDLVIIFDVFHILSNQAEVLTEIHRVLKQDGIMSFSDHHMKEAEILKRLTKNRLFKLVKKGKMTFNFSKI